MKPRIYTVTDRGTSLIECVVREKRDSHWAHVPDAGIQKIVLGVRTQVSRSALSYKRCDSHLNAKALDVYAASALDLG